MADPSNIRFPTKKTDSLGSLSLRRNRSETGSPFSVSEASAQARESIRAIVSATRPPMGGRSAAEDARVADLERSLRQLELKLVERERIVQERESRLKEYERELAEAEALLAAREQLVAASRKSVAAPAHVSPEEKAALEGLRAELERQEAALKEAQSSLHERERFMEDSETRLFEKVQSQQEREIELDQREEDMKVKIRKSREALAVGDADAAAVLKAEDEAAADDPEMRA
jgi:chromosome segregation ATPase